MHHTRQTQNKNRPTNPVVIEVSSQTELLGLWIIVTLPLSKLLTADALVLVLPL